MSQADESLIAALSHRYRVTGELGRGGMATVYLADDLKHQRRVAIKVLRPELAAALGAERFLREITTTANLRHPHILPLYDSGEAGDLLYYVMPYVEGESLRDRLDREHQLPLDDALRIATEVADALGYAHSRGIVHRDIKPENILLEGGHAIVADFGIARAVTAAGGTTLTATGVAIGTPAYMSPEQAMGGHGLDGRSDIYALGCVLHEMLAGEPPFTGPTAESLVHQHASVPAPPVTNLRPAVPIPIVRALGKALAKTPADRFTTTAQFVEALRAGAGDPPLELSAPSGRPRALPWWIVAAVALVAILGLGAYLVLRPRAARSLNADLLAVAPFDVLVPSLTLWHEGLVDVLSRDLDGAGPLETVAPTVVVKGWNARADRTSAAALGKRTGARLVLFGSVIGAGPDSVRLTASVLDVQTGKVVAEVEYREMVDRMDRLADSVTVKILSALPLTHAVRVERLASLGTKSLRALKAFLQGEQYFRRTQWDSAHAAYAEAIQYDSTFAMALRRMSEVIGRQRWSRFDPQAIAYRLRAAAFNHGLTRRDSLLVVADSIQAALFEGDADTLFASHVHRLFATLQVATQAYPDDPEPWPLLGEAYYHFGEFIGIGTPAQSLAAFEHAIAADSTFTPAYIHVVELGLLVGGPETGRRDADRYLAILPPDGVEATGTRLVALLLDPRTAASASTAHFLDTATIGAVQRAMQTFDGWPDSAETALRLARVVLARHNSTAPSSDQELVLARFLGARGHLRAALAADPPPDIFAELVDLGAVSPQAAADTFAGALAHAPVGTADLGLDWWAAHHDTAALRTLERRARDVVAHGTSQERPVARWTELADAAYLDLARNDSAAALRALAALPDTLCGCLEVRRRAYLHLASIEEHRGDLAAAAHVLNRRFWEAPTAETAVFMLARGRVDERLGKRDLALAAYRYVVDAWRAPDPSLLPFVRQARAGLARLTQHTGGTS